MTMMLINNISACCSIKLHQRQLHIKLAFVIQSTFSSISSPIWIVSRRRVVIWKALITLYRLVLQSRHDMNLLSIESTKSTSTIRLSSPRSTFHSILQKERITMRPPLQSSFQAPSISAIITATARAEALAKRTHSRTIR